MKKDDSGLVRVDRRNRKRAPDHAAAVVKILSSSGNPGSVPDAGFCNTDDLSDSGMRLSLDEHIPVDTSLRVSVSFIDLKKVFNLVGRVAWSRKLSGGPLYSVGLDFAGMPEDTMAEWKSIIEYKLRARDSDAVQEQT